MIRRRLPHVLCCMMSTGLATASVAQQRPHYQLDLRLSPDTAVMVGRADVRLPPEVVADGSLRLDVSLAGGRRIEIQRVIFSGGLEVVGVAPDTSGVVTITAPAGISPTVHIDYAVQVDSTAREPFGYYVFAGSGFGGWPYPQLLLPDGSHPRFLDFDVALAYPASFAVLTTGGEGAPRRVGAWVTADYHAVHVEGFAIVAGEGFRVERHTETEVPVVAFFHPSHAAEFEVAVRRAAEAATWYRRTYGFFPLEQIGIIQGHPRWSGGFPLPNLFAIHLGTLTDEFLAFITAHELGHYYWGLYVLGDEERLDWLQLALGIWADQRYLAERSGRDLSEQWRRAGNGDWIGDYLTAVAAGYEQRLGVPEDEEDALPFDYNTLIRHGKGATGVYLQSRLLGQDRFLELQRQLLRQYRYRPLPVADFVALLDSAGLEDAPAFFGAWQRGDGVIGLSVDEVVPESDGGWRVAVVRTGPVPYPIGVEVRTAGGAPVRATVPARARRDTIRTATRPTAVLLDPDGLVPMWNSAHPGMRAVLAGALDRAGADAQFIPLAHRLLAEHPDAHYVRYRLARKLFWIGRWEDAAALWPADAACGSRDACLAGLYAARAVGRLGRAEHALRLLTVLRPGVEAADLLGFWETVRAEVRPPEAQ